MSNVVCSYADAERTSVKFGDSLKIIITIKRNKLQQDVSCYGRDFSLFN